MRYRGGERARAGANGCGGIDEDEEAAFIAMHRDLGNGYGSEISAMRQEIVLLWGFPSLRRLVYYVGKCKLSPAFKDAIQLILPSLTDPSNRRMHVV